MTMMMLRRARMITITILMALMANRTKMTLMKLIKSVEQHVAWDDNMSVLMMIYDNDESSLS